LEAAIPCIYVTSLINQAQRVGISQEQIENAIQNLRVAGWLEVRGDYLLVTVEGIDQRQLLPQFNTVRLDEAFIRGEAIHLQYEDSEGAAIAILAPGCPAIVQRGER
jgi:hypothetical protein